jgi:hypothetical protein
MRPFPSRARPSRNPPVRPPEVYDVGSVAGDDEPPVVREREAVGNGVRRELVGHLDRTVRYAEGDAHDVRRRALHHVKPLPGGVHGQPVREAERPFVEDLRRAVRADHPNHPGPPRVPVVAGIGDVEVARHVEGWEVGYFHLPVRRSCGALCHRSVRVDPDDGGPGRIAGVDTPVPVQREAQQEPARTGDLTLGAVRVDPVELPQLPAAVDLPLRPDAQPFGVVQLLPQHPHVLRRCDHGIPPHPALCPGTGPSFCSLRPSPPGERVPLSKVVPFGLSRKVIHQALRQRERGAEVYHLGVRDGARMLGG